LENLEWALDHHDYHGWRAVQFERWAKRRIRQIAGFYADRCVMLNQIQVLGTHNSYHVQPHPRLLSLYLFLTPAAMAWEYTHLPLDEQFEFQGVRQIELDVFADPDGGLFAEPLGLKLLERDRNAHIPELDPPGMKVLHVQDLDFETTCNTLIDCLEIVKSWSDANPRHLPLVILIEAKDTPLGNPERTRFAVPIPFGSKEFEDLDSEIRSVFPSRQLITPDDVRGTAETLEQAVLSAGWPTLAASRGRILFALDNGGSKREIYIEGRPSLEGRVMFTNGVEGQPDAAFIKLNDPVRDGVRITELVSKGYIVRTRADSDTVEARNNDTQRRDTALASGAQYVSTDFPEPNLDFSEYLVTIPGGEPARCNPINAPGGCRDFALEPRRRFPPW
jgi:hypothetical protein